MSNFSVFHKNSFLVTLFKTKVEYFIISENTAYLLKFEYLKLLRQNRLVLYTFSLECVKTDGDTEY